MSDPYERVNGGRLAFKGGDLATRKSIEKKKKKHKKNKEKLVDGAAGEVKMAPDGSATSAAAPDDIYSIDAAKKKKYDELFPVEAKKFGYVPKSNFESMEDALDDRVKKKADRYCK
ncbi:hypothetical protein CARUB_v10011794mg [Capsella rubella]|uniref:Uncharacterized protein n=1 Tax=Capsella rubella TaxID=81985 RepID=R0GT30_9BRAS|nr:uncharacterized protein LOC17900135 [Capsella rubella]EOA39082.1 hypothetical protein CARUB_v10011794mg [Capsella rubella]